LQGITFSCNAPWTGAQYCCT